MDSQKNFTTIFSSHQRLFVSATLWWCLLFALPALAAPAPARIPGPDAALQTAPGAVSSTPATAYSAGTAEAAPPEPHVGPGQVRFNFQNADIRAVVKTVSEMTGRNFLLDPQVHGKVTIISASPVSRAAAYQIFLTALKAQGFTGVAGPGGIVRILPQAEGNQSAPVSRLVIPRGGDQLVTQVVRLQHSSAAQMMPLLRPLMAPTGVLSVYAPGNLLVITDFADNVRRLLRIVHKIDRAGNAAVAVIPLKYASAIDMAHLLIHLTRAGALTTGPMAGQVPGMVSMTTIVPDLRTNSIIVRTDTIGRLDQIRSLIHELDIPARKSGQTHVVYLRNASAKKLARILRGLLEGEARAARATTAASPASPAGAVPAVAHTLRPSLIEADSSSNALVISAPDAIYNNLRNVIAKLDVRRAQVFVQTLIAEVASTRAAEFGIQWGVGAPVGGGTVAGLANFPLTGSGIVSDVLSPSNVATAAGLSVGYIGETITLPSGQTVTGAGCACACPPAGYRCQRTVDTGSVDARQCDRKDHGWPERAIRHRELRAGVGCGRFRDQSVSDHRAQGCWPEPQDQAADLCRRRDQARHS